MNGKPLEFANHIRATSETQPKTYRRPLDDFGNRELRWMLALIRSVRTGMPKAIIVGTDRFRLCIALASMGVIRFDHVDGRMWAARRPLQTRAMKGGC